MKGAKKNMSAKKLFLHIGHPKTATSSIQKSLFESYEALKKHKILYPKSIGPFHQDNILSVFHQHPESIQSNIKKGLTKKEIENKDKETCNKIIEEVNNNKTADILIISAENLMYLSEESIYRMRQWFLSNLSTFKITILFTVRNPISLYSSNLQERIKSGRRIRFDISIPVKKGLSNYIKIFGKENILVSDFESECRNENGPVGAFLERISFPKNEISKLNIVRKNESLSKQAIEIIYYIETKYSRFQGNQISFGRQAKDTYPLYSIEGEKYEPNKSLIQSFLKKYKDENLWLKENFGIDYTNIKITDSKDKPITYDEKYKNQFLETFSQLTKLLQNISYQFVIEKINKLEDEKHKTLFRSIKKEILSSYPDIVNIDYKNYLKQKNSNYFNLEMLRSKLKIDNSLQSADIYRDIAVFLEQYNQIEAAYFCMKLAQINRPNGPFICKKVDEYYKKTKVENKEKATSGIKKTIISLLKR